MTIRGRSVVHALAIAVVAAPCLLGQQGVPRSAALAGVIRDSTGRGIAMATILVDSAVASAVSDSAGRFHLGGLEPGRAGFTIVRLGYQPLSFEMTLAADSTVMIDVRMRTIQTLGAVEVSAKRLNAGLVRMGFFDRRRTARGSFVSPERVDSLSRFATRASQLFRDVNGVEVFCRMNNCQVLSRMEPSCLNVFIDGAFVQDGTLLLDDLIMPGAVAAIEVYTRPSQVPVAFQARLPIKQSQDLTKQAGCGSLVIWTRARAGALGQ